MFQKHMKKLCLVAGKRRHVHDTNIMHSLALKLTLKLIAVFEDPVTCPFIGSILHFH